MHEFNVYILPRGCITAGASAVNKLRKKGQKLYLGEKRVDAVGLNQGITRLLLWLRQRMPCLLISHNAKLFDAKHLLRAVSTCKETDEFSKKVLGFSDSLTAFRERFPGRTSYSQTNLVKDLLGATYNAHNALDDVRMLQKLVSKYISNDLLLKHSFTVSWYKRYLFYCQITRENLKSLEILLNNGKISQGMALKIARSGLKMEDMEFAFQNGGGENLCAVLSEVYEGKPRVTNNRKILLDICSFFDGSRVG